MPEVESRPSTCTCGILFAQLGLLHFNGVRKNNITKNVCIVQWLVPIKTCWQESIYIRKNLDRFYKLLNLFDISNSTTGNPIQQHIN